MSLTAGKTAHLKNLSTPQGVIAAAAMDQRGSLKKSIAVAKGVAESAVRMFRSTPFVGGRHQRRVDLIEKDSAKS